MRFVALLFLSKILFRALWTSLPFPPYSQTLQHLRALPLQQSLLSEL